MTQMLLFSKYFDECAVGDFLHHPWAKNRNMESTFFSGEYMTSLKRNILSEYQNWLREMADQDRKFTPFEMHRDASRVFDLVKGVSPRRLLTIDRNFDLFNKRLNATSGTSTTGDKEQQLMELFYLATKELVKDKFNIE